MDHSGSPDFVHRSHGMRRLLAALQHLPRADRFVVVRGEPGSGRRRVASWLHRVWWSHGEPIVLDCSLSASMLRPSFAHPLAIYGEQPRTLVLHGVTELDASLYRKARGLVDDLRVGDASGWTLVAIDGAQPAATSGALESLLIRFRNAPTLLVPPLRERRMDIAGLVRELLTEICCEMGAIPNRIAADAVDALASYHWPANLPELRAALERARLAAGDDRIELSHLPGEIRSPLRSGAREVHVPLAEVERAHILATLQRYGGHRGDTAEALGIHVNTLCKKLAAYGVGRRRRPRPLGAR